MKRSVSSGLKANPAVIPAVPGAESPGEAQESPNMVTSYRWAWYGLSLFVPLAGIFIALFLYDQESREVRKVGRLCLLIGFSIWVILPLLVILALFLVTLFAAFSWVADMATTGD